MEASDEFAADGSPPAPRSQQEFESGNRGMDVKTKAASAFTASSPVAAVLAYWKDLDLESEIRKLDEQAMRIGENQEASLKSRRKLSESTRDFKKRLNARKQDEGKETLDKELLDLFPALLKSYQEEIDNLTKRAKFAESSFLSIYQKLFEAPDPTPSLASASSSFAKVAELEAENRKMRQELEEFRTEAAHLKNQQATVRRLEERTRHLEQQMEEKVREIVEMKQRSLAEENQKILEALKDRETSLQEQLRTAHDSVQNMQRLHELGQSQLFELRSQSEEDRAAKHSELMLLSDEVERAQSRLLSLEREKDHLRSQLQDAGSEEVKLRERQDLDVSTMLEASLDAKEKVISELHLELRNLESTLASEREQHVAELRKLNASLDEKDASVEELRKELSGRPTSKQLDDLRKQLKIFQAVGYNTIETDDWDSEQAQQISKLEGLLLEKNRKLEHELTQVKVLLSEKTDALKNGEVLINELESEVERQKKLITKLEEDLFKGYNAIDRKTSNDWDLSESGIIDLLESDRGGVDREQNSMLEVICSQRDRFRQRLSLTEEELRQTKDRCNSLMSELEKCKADNIKLYEKIRYIQDYTKDRPVSRAPKKRMDDLESGVDIEAKYKKLYEDDINPFTAFSRKERERRYKDLGFRDKITLLSGRFLLANKYARTFIFFYAIGLHLLVFASLYRFSSVSYHNVTKDAAIFEGSKPANGSLFISSP